MRSTDLSQALHVVSGHSAAALLRQAFRFGRDRFLVTEDPLCYGPVPSTPELDAWRALREQYLSDLYNRPGEPPEDEYHPKGLETERLLGSDPVVVWVAGVLPEQLMLARVVVLFEQLGLDASRLRVVQVEQPEDVEVTWKIGSISPDQLQRLCPEPHELDADQLREFKRAWDVYTSREPSDLASYVAEQGCLPFLHRAMCQLVFRYPDIRSGTSVWDERLLHYTRERGPRALRVLGHTIGNNDTSDWIDDVYLFRRLLSLSRPTLASPLVSATGDTETLRECRVELTRFGEKVLAGEANQVRENGIDDWIGGVHPTSNGPTTFRDADTLVLPS
jgi:hypothetical protein